MDWKGRAWLPFDVDLEVTLHVSAEDWFGVLDREEAGAAEAEDAKGEAEE